MASFEELLTSDLFRFISAKHNRSAATVP